MYDSVMEKICSKCGCTKDVSEFSKNRTTKDGYAYRCKQCVKEFYKDPVNKAKRAESDKAYYLNNKEKIQKYKSDWTALNKVRLKRKYLKWYAENKERVFRAQVEKRRNNKEARISHALRTRLSKVVHGDMKAATTKELTGCSFAELISHLESLFTEGMSWDNYGKYGWHIDHIRPCASFDLSDPEQQRECFHYTNLQPLWAFDNHSKGDKLPNTIVSSI